MAENALSYLSDTSCRLTMLYNISTLQMYHTIHACLSACSCPEDAGRLSTAVACGHDVHVLSSSRLAPHVPCYAIWAGPLILCT